MKLRRKRVASSRMLEAQTCTSCGHVALRPVGRIVDPRTGASTCVRCGAETGAEPRAGRVRIVRVLGASITVLVLCAGSAGAAPTAPKGYRVVRQAALASGLTHIELAEGAGDQRVHVARIAAGSSLSLRPVLAGNSVSGKTAVERTSAMCVRVRCLAAINADFFAGTGIPTGGVVMNGEPIRSALSRGGQVLIDEKGILDTGHLAFEIAFVAADLERIPVAVVNRPTRGEAIGMFTPRFGKTTATAKSTVEMTLRVIRPSGPLKLDQTTSVRITSLTGTGNATIPTDGVVLAARGAGARSLRALWRKISADPEMADALIRIDAPSDTTQSVGGRPVLLRDNKRVSNGDTSNFSVGENPRTIVGRTANGDVLLVTIDGRQPGYSDGMSLREATTLMRSLGAVDAINLDGGGSTTFVVGGKVVNRPSDRAVRTGKIDRIVPAPGDGDRVIGNVERPVAVALVVVDPRTPAAAPPPKPSGFTLGLASDRVLALAAPTAEDPASNPDAALPAIIASGRATTPTSREMTIALSAMLWSALAAMWLLVRERQRRWSTADGPMDPARRVRRDPSA